MTDTIHTSRAPDAHERTEPRARPPQSSKRSKRLTQHEKDVLFAFIDGKTTKVATMREIAQICDKLRKLAGVKR